MTRAARAKHCPPDRAKKLKKAWVEKAKIKSKWKAEKRKAGLPSPSLPSGEKRTGKALPSEPKDPESVMEQPPAQSSEQTQHPVRDGPSVRELRRKAYSNCRHPDRRDTDFGGKMSQPDMKLRMNTLLAKIKRDYQN